MSATRDRILSSAVDLYMEDGFDGFSMRKLARSLGVTAPSLYRHFQGKEQLLLEIVKEAYKVMAQYLHRALGGETPAERFRMAGDGYLRFALEHPRYYEVLYSYIELLGLDGVPGELQEVCNAMDQYWHDRVRECVDEGLLKPGDPGVIGQTFWALSHGLITLHQRKMLGLTEEQLCEMFDRSMAHLLHGVGTDRWVASGGPDGNGMVEGEDGRKREAYDRALRAEGG
jgi:AcrR family transcriptional regulator